MPSNCENKDATSIEEENAGITSNGKKHALYGLNQKIIRLPCQAE